MPLSYNQTLIDERRELKPKECDMKKKIGYLESLIKSNTGDSSKSFALVVSVLMGVIIGLVVCIALLYDLFSDGVVSMDLQDLGIFLLCSGGYILSSSGSKILTERFEKKKKCITEDESGAEEENNNEE